jgi:hypothetical protein
MEADLNYICCCGQRGSCRGACALLEMEAAAAADCVCLVPADVVRHSGSVPQWMVGLAPAPLLGRLGARFSPRLPRGPARSHNSTAPPESKQRQDREAVGADYGCREEGEGEGAGEEEERRVTACRRSSRPRRQQGETGG